MKKMMMKSKGMARGGRMKAKGMARGGKAMKSKGYAKGGATGGKKKKMAKKPAMTLASIRAAAKAKGYKLVKMA